MDNLLLSSNGWDDSLDDDQDEDEFWLIDYNIFIK